MWVQNGTDYITNTQFYGEIPDDPNASHIESIWKIDPLVNGGYPYITLMPDLEKLELYPVPQTRYITIYTPRSVGGQTVYPSIEEMVDGTGATTNGDAVLLPVSCDYPDNLNGMRSVSIVHPIDEEGRYKYIRIGAIVKVMGQLFTVMSVDERWNGNSGQISFYAEDVFYQQNDKYIYPRLPETGAQIRLIGFSGQHALNTIDSFSRDEARTGSFSYPFTHSSDLPQFPLDDYWIMPIDNGCTPIEAILGSGGLIECKGGELYRDNFYYSINERMEGASDHAFDIRIGKNLTGIRRVVDISSMVTYFRAYDPYGGLFAVAWDFGAFFGNLFPHYVVRSQNFDFPAEANDEDSGWDYGEWFSNVFIPQAMAYFSKNGKPIVRYEIDLEDVRRNPDFEIIGDENFRVGDKGRVWDARFGDEPLTIEVTGTVYDGIREKCKQVIIGDRQSFVQTAMPAVEWDAVPQIVTATVPILDCDGNFILDADGKQIVQEVQINA